jgi:hypothetical protein
VSAATQQLPAFENEDYGLLLYGLASLGQPLPPAMLAALCAQVQRKLPALSGEGLALLVWGLAQYGYDGAHRGSGGGGGDAAGTWWREVYAEWCAKWDGMGLRGAACAALGIAQLGPAHAPPGEWETGWVQRYRALLGPEGRPGSWRELLVGLRCAAGCEPGEGLPDSAWLCTLLLQLGKALGLQEPAAGAAALAALVADVNAEAAVAGDAAAAAAAGGTALDDARASWALGMVGAQQQRPQPASATAVLL